MQNVITNSLVTTVNPAVQRGRREEPHERSNSPQHNMVY